MDKGKDAKASPSRKSRCDGIASRAAILEAAGRLFAERGYAATTCKEIAERAGVLPALINYYFGGKEALYSEVLVAGHGTILDMEELKEIAAADDPALVRLERIARLIMRAAETAPDNWGVRVLVREMYDQSDASCAVLHEAVFPKLEIARRVIAEACGVPADSPAAREKLAAAMLPCMALVIMPERVRKFLLPGGKLDQAFIDAMVRNMIAGISN